MALNSDGTKTCPRCSTAKLPPGNFYKAGSSTDGWSGYCIPCTKAAATAWQKALPEDRRRTKNKRDWEAIKLSPERRQRRAASVKAWINKSPENKAKHRAWQAAYKQRDPERRRQQNAIHNNHQRAKKLGRTSNFQFIDWLHALEVYEHRCAYCSVAGALLDLDHLDALDAGGHNVVGNIVPACRICNAQKWRHTVAEFCAARGLDEAAIRARAASLLLPASA